MLWMPVVSASSSDSRVDGCGRWSGTPGCEGAEEDRCRAVLGHGLLTERTFETVWDVKWFVRMEGRERRVAEGLIG